MKKTTLALAALLGTFTYAGTVSAATILLDQASNLPTSAYAPVGSNSLGITYNPSDFIFVGVAGGINATQGNTSSNTGGAGIVGFYAANSSDYANLTAAEAANGGNPLFFGYNLYAPASQGGGLSGVLIEEFAAAGSGAILTQTVMYTSSLSGYVPTLGAGATGSITETGSVQDAINQFGLDVQIRGNAAAPVATPLPAAIFFVAPALAGLFGFSRRKHSEA